VAVGGERMVGSRALRGGGERGARSGASGLRPSLLGAGL
jgi:hypothetical protein